MRTRRQQIHEATEGDMKKCVICGRARWWHLLRKHIRRQDDATDNGHSFQGEPRRISTGRTIVVVALLRRKGGNRKEMLKKEYHGGKPKKAVKRCGKNVQSC